VLEALLDAIAKMLESCGLVVRSGYPGELAHTVTRLLGCLLHRRIAVWMQHASVRGLQRLFLSGPNGPPTWSRPYGGVCIPQSPLGVPADTPTLPAIGAPILPGCNQSRHSAAGADRCLASARQPPAPVGMSRRF